MSALTAPHSLEAEAAVIGAVLLDNDALNHVADLTPAMFYAPFHADAFRTIRAMAGAGQAFDVIATFDAMRADGKAAQGDLVRLHDLAQYVPSATTIRRHAAVVAERHRQRELMRAGQKIVDLAASSGTSAEQIDAAQMMLAKLATAKSKREPQHINESLVAYLSLLNDLSEGKNPAIATGIDGLDRLLNGGLRRGEMMVIGARPKNGKTALALALARNMARDYNVLFLSQEMPVSQLMHRHTAAAGSFDLGRILRADPKDHDMWSAVSEAAQRLGDLHLVHDDQSSLTLLEIRRKALKVRREHGLDVLFVDFLQLMAGAGEENRNRELDVIVNGIKALALDLQIGVVVLSQMSRKADEHYGRPTMSHLRDSGAIEAAADQIALLFTDWAHPSSKREPAFQGFSELEIVAHRNGPQGLVPLRFEGARQQITDWDGAVPTRSAAPKPVSRGMSS
ncbi:DnaB-like helicase C-terminal domain-containing protein [Variovorax sp. YR216]|uniref:replicative DNA helicase n=1 Tax=Variovorax sp. YR216 TaxID=1882828 RepID=UPI00089A420F|nr:DnaB-like helicase C-terminal domain-containing protein [Variovorax sp. YR216]SEA76586.1 replicative DNA helicase [Variovorax sp. YR216]